MLKKGFTLSEVLITLGIIGVVAAMTLPVLIARYQERQWTTAYLRVYSLLENAYRMTQNEHGTFENWAGASITKDDSGQLNRSNSDATSIYNVMIKNYFKLNRSFFDMKSNDINCWPERSYSLSGEDFLTTGYVHSKNVVSLVSGECIILGDPTGDFIFDLNSKKGPNTLGKDQFIFSFDILKPERIKPGYYQRSWTDVPELCMQDSNTTAWVNGSSCGFWILRHHNMDYLHLSGTDIREKWNGGGW